MWLVPAVVAGGLSAYTVDSVSISHAPRGIPTLQAKRRTTGPSSPTHCRKEESHTRRFLNPPSSSSSTCGL